MADDNTSNDEIDSPNSNNEVDVKDDSTIVDDSAVDEAADADKSDDDSEDTESKDDDKSDKQDSEDEEAEFKKAFSQIKGDTAQEYIPHLEEAYRKSSAEGKRLSIENKQLQDRIDQINEAVAKNPELAKQIMEATAEDAIPPTVDPGVLKARQDYNDQAEKDLKTFFDEHPTLAEDEGLVKRFTKNIAIVSKAERDEGRIIEPMVAYKRALGMMDYDYSKDKVLDVAKNSAAKSNTSSATKPKAKSSADDLTPEQIAFAKKMGLTEQELRQARKQ